MMIRKYCLILLLSILSGILIHCKTVDLQSHWLEQPISIDGHDMDWEAIPSHGSLSMPLSMKFCNNAENLYLLLVAEDPLAAQNLRTGILSLSFFKDHDKKPSLSINYTGADSSRPDYNPNDSFWQCLNDAQKNRFKKRQSALDNMIKVVKNEKLIPVHSDGSQGLAAASVYQENFFIGYEFQIPLENNDNGNHIASRPPEKIGILIKPIRRGNIQSAGYPNEPRDPMIEGGDMGFMGGPGGGRFNQRPGKPFWESEIRIHVILVDGS